MRSTAAILQRTIASPGGGPWKYIPSPVRFGRYPVLEPWMSMTEYPEIRPVPESIPRPPYVPTNFFTDGWGDHLPGSNLKFDEKLGRDGEDGVRRAGKVVAQLLKEVGRIIKVRLRLGSCSVVVLWFLSSPRSVAWYHYQRDRCVCSRGYCSQGGIPLTARLLSIPPQLYYFRQ